ncbi:hypothetical protein [Streptomyces sp. NPDC002994]|uniref:hypothetical protein n=1 Tax=Streptomyces sp. NPDC002994 TaxID=3154441 RepID=UPI0033AB13A5
MREMAGKEQDLVGFAASVSYFPYKKPCSLPGREYCTPIPARRLPRDGVLIVLRLQHGTGPSAKDRPLGAVTERRGPDVVKSCRVPGGTRELVVWHRAPAGAEAVSEAVEAGPATHPHLEARACLADPSAERVEEVRRVLDSVTFGSKNKKTKGTK